MESEEPEETRPRCATIFEEAQDHVATCCFDLFESRNKIVPSVIPQNCEDFDFVEISPQRRLRVIHLKPFQNRSFGNEEETSTGDETDEEYWFENAAPKRLPVIQPQPQPQQNRIINKFEPREPPSVANTSKSFHDDFISPGRLPRKALSTKLLETDDFEDDQTVKTTTGEELPSDSSESPNKINTNLSGLEQMSEILLEITAEGTAKKMKNKNKSWERSTSPSSMSSSRSASPDTPGAADDSLHPSPELPHRAVCARPDAVDSANSVTENTTSIIITGGNLGGVANKGFAQDDEEEDFVVDDSQNSNSSNDEPGESQVDCGYSRNRDPQALIASLDVTDNSIENEVDTDKVIVEDLPPVLFFIHGVGGSADSWTTQLAYFVGQGYECVAPDLLGHGYSSCPDNQKAYTFTKLFKDILTIFDTYIPENRKCIVFGHSYGCSFSTALTRVRLERVVTLVLIAGGGPTPLAPPLTISKYPKCVKTLLRTVMECKVKNQQNKYSPRGKTIKFRESYDMPKYVVKHIAAGALWPEGDTALHRRITVPTLLVYGMRDDLVSLVEECEMEKTLPR